MEEEETRAEELETNRIISAFEDLDAELATRILELSNGSVDDVTDEILATIERNVSFTEKKSMIDDTKSSFPELNEQDIEKVLELNSWDPVASVKPLVEMLESIENQKDQEQKKRRRELVSVLSQHVLVKGSSHTNIDVARVALEKTGWNEQKAKILILNLEEDGAQKLVDASSNDAEKKEDVSIKVSNKLNVNVMLFQVDIM